MAKCLVTGGAGFIGSHIAERLLRDGHEVRILDDLSSGRRQNLDGFQGELELVEGDIRDPDTVRRATHGMDTVFHQAATASVPRSVEDPAATNETNLTGTLNVLLACRDQNVRRVVFASSSSIYGDSEEMPKLESMAMNPLSPYALQKAAGETYMRLFHKLYGLETVSLRYFNIFGPRQDPNSEYSAVIPKFISALVRGAPITLHGDGEQSRDFTYVENVVDANLAAMRAPASSCGRMFNIACGEAYSLNHLVNELERISGRRALRQHGPARLGDVRHSLADIGAARESLGYLPKITFEEGLVRTYRHFAT
ncbi:MAG: SDR family oxidoreductase [Oligoflexia bacterium]|nr:SDR family oxidoreductase [Oligoflexia bacterium]